MREVLKREEGKSLRPNNRGAIEGLPLKLVIISIVLGIMVPAIFAWLISYDHSQLESSLEGELYRLAQRAQLAYLNPASQLCIDLTVPSGTFAHTEYLRIGGESEPENRSIAYRIRGEYESPTYLDFHIADSTGNKILLAPKASPYQVCFIRYLGDDNVTAKVMG